MKTHTVLNWSSGKDAALAFLELQRSGTHEVTRLLTTVSGTTDRVVMHGVRAGVLERQAALTGLPLEQVLLPAAQDHEAYAAAMGTTLDRLKQQGIRAAAFGDIFLEDLRHYREAQLAQAGMEAVFPLWRRNTAELVRAIEEAGIRAVIVCVDEQCLGPQFLGRTVDRALLDALPEGVDPCGEHGEFHTLVTEAPFFREPLAVQPGEIVCRTYPSAADGAWDTGFYFLDMQLS